MASRHQPQPRPSPGPAMLMIRNGLQALLAAKNEIFRLVPEDCYWSSSGWRFNGIVHDQNRLLYDKVTVLESEKRAWESSPEAQAIREGLNPWRNRDAETRRNS
ncbi:hypothetical protein CICLE_v10006724mg [Citrus x clementina]|uniref:Uncharacterized protein n=1 Tax=Citrus clementina TaxID=85681 RepID=V4U108_CITCL|nr:hypothetical protein CICLE_v10006724mg [Citrus x clementina]